MTTATGINANIRAEMGRQKITQSQLAAILGVKQQTVSRRLSGEWDWPVGELSTVASALGVSLAALLPAEAVQESA